MRAQAHLVTKPLSLYGLRLPPALSSPTWSQSLSLSMAFACPLPSPAPPSLPSRSPQLPMALSSQGCFQPLSCAPTPGSLHHPLPEPQSLTAPLPASLVNELLISALGKHRRSLLLSTLAFAKLEEIIVHRQGSINYKEDLISARS